MVVDRTFGSWARARRRELDLTQQEMAALVGCATVTVRKIEADERRPSKQMAERFAEVLAIPAADRERFVAAARGFRAPAVVLVPAQRETSRLPAVFTSLVGRDRELAELLALIENGPSRLITVVGAPGVGKTRLAIEAVRRASALLDVPAVFVPLAQRVRPEEIVTGLADVLRVSTTGTGDERSAVTARLRSAPVIALLDNLEQIDGAGPQVAALLEESATTVCVVTSRRPLDVYGEYEFHLDPLRLEPADGEDVAPAVQLFLERARAVGRGASTSADLVAVEAVCRLLDGIPLALELAARRLRRRTLGGLHAELTDGVPNLGSGPIDRDGRHATMEATIAWSYELLDSRARTVLRHAAVFRSAFSAEGLAAIMPAAASEDVVAALDHLADHSLLIEGDGPRRYRLLEVIRTFASERAEELGEWQPARRRHAEWVLSAVPTTPWGTMSTWSSDTVVADEEAVGAVLWAAGSDGDRHLAQRVLLGHGWQWYLLGRLTMLDRLLDRVGAADDPVLEVPLTVLAGQVRWAMADLGGAYARLRPIVDAPDAPDPTRAWWQDQAVGLVAMAHVLGDDPAAALPMLQRCRRLHSVHGDDSVLAMNVLREGRVAMRCGRLDEAAPLVEEAMALYRSSGVEWGYWNSLGTLAEVTAAAGDTALALARFLEAISGLVDVGAESYAAFRLAGVASLLARTGRPRPAAQVVGIVMQWLDELGTTIFPVGEAAFREAQARVAADLGDRLAAREIEVGRSMPRSVAAIRALLSA